MKTVKAFTRRNVLTAGTIAIGSSLLPKSLALPERPVQKDTLTPAATIILARVHTRAKAGNLTAHDLGTVSGVLHTMWFSWVADGTMAELQRHITQEAIDNFSMTDDMMSQVVVAANKGGASMEIADLARLANMDKSAMVPDVNAFLSTILNGLEQGAVMIPAGHSYNVYKHIPNLKRTFFMPYEYCRALNNATAAAGLTAGISVFFNPGVAAIFGLIAGITAAATALGGC